MNKSLMTQMLIEIVNVFNREGLSVEPQPVIESVHVTTMPFRLLAAGKSKTSLAKNLGETIESALGLSPIRISRKNGLVNVELPIGNGQRIYCERLPVAADSMTVNIGLDTSNQLITHDFTTYPHLAFVGKTNFGKTSNARSVIWQLLQQNADLEVYICCYKPADWSQFEDSCTVVSDEASTLAVLCSASALMAARGKQRTKTPTILLVLDDATQLVDNEDIVAELAKLAPLCRGMGILLMPILQRLSGLDARFTGNLSAKCIFSVASAQDAALLSGHGGSGAELLSKPGDALYFVDGTPTRYAALSLRDSTVLAHRATGSALHVSTEAGSSARNDENSRFGGLQQAVENGNANRDYGWEKIAQLLERVEIKGAPKSDQQRAYIRLVYELSGDNLRTTSKFIWGSTGGTNYQYIRDCCGLVPPSQPPQPTDDSEQFSISIPALQTA